jgi:hypothetical protein
MHRDYLLLCPVASLDHTFPSDYDASLEIRLVVIPEKSPKVLTLSKWCQALYIIVTPKRQKFHFLKYYDIDTF